MPLNIDKLILLIKEGDHQSFRVLVENYQQYAFNLAFKILCEEEEARDIVQESFIKIWKNIGKYKLQIKFTTWMYTIVTNTAIDRLRSKKRMETVNIDLVLEKLEQTPWEQMETQLDNKEAGQLIRLISDSLPEKQKLVFILRDLNGLASQEVEHILNIPETSVKSNLYHARKAIREKLNLITSFERRVL